MIKQNTIAKKIFLLVIPAWSASLSCSSLGFDTSSSLRNGACKLDAFLVRRVVILLLVYRLDIRLSCFERSTFCFLLLSYSSVRLWC